MQKNEFLGYPSRVCPKQKPSPNYGVRLPALDSSKITPFAWTPQENSTEKRAVRIVDIQKTHKQKLNDVLSGAVNFLNPILFPTLESPIISNKQTRMPKNLSSRPITIVDFDFQDA